MVRLKSHELLQILSKFLPNEEEITLRIKLILIKGYHNLQLIRKLGETPGQTFFLKVFKHLHPRQSKVAIYISITLVKIYILTFVP